MMDNWGLILQSLIVPAAMSPIALWLGRDLKHKAGWLVFAAMMYPTIIYGYVSIGIYLGLINEGLTASYPWTSLLDQFTLLADGFSSPIAFLISLLSALIAVYSIDYMEGSENLESYYALYLLYAVGMIGTVVSTNLVAFFLFFELMLIPSWALIAVWGTGRKEAIAFKYFMYTEAGALSLLAGILLTKYASGTFEIFQVAERVKTGPPGFITLIVSLILLGLLVKMAIFPLHNWLPDAHAEAPTPISALLSPAMIGIGGYAAIRIIYTAFPTVMDNSRFTTTLLGLAVTTMFYGGLMALAQKDLKRLLAFSSISQMGYLLLGAASASTLGLTGAGVLYLSHGLAKAILFMVSGVFMHSFHTRLIDDLGGLAGKMPYTATATLIAFLSLAGVPPLLGFWGEIFVFAGSMKTALTSILAPDMTRVWLTSLAVISSIITAGYGLWAYRRMFFGELKPSLRIEKSEAPSLMLAPIIILAVITILLGIYPTTISQVMAQLFTNLKLPP